MLKFRCLVNAFAVVFISSYLMAESSPVSRKDIEKRVMNYVNNTEKSNIIKIENTGGTMRKIRKGLIVYPLYQQPVFIYWEGTYGQVVKEVVYFEFIKTNNEWVYEQTIPGLPKDTVMVKNPNKPLPPPPAEPGKDEVKKVLDKYAPEYSSKTSYSFEILSLSEPEFNWDGFDFQNGIYTYKGRTRWVKKEKGDLLSVLDSGETWECDFEAVMTYVKDKKRSDIDRRFMEESSSGWTGSIKMDKNKAKKIE